MRLLLVAQLQFIPLELGFALLVTAMAMGVSAIRITGGFMTPGEAIAVVLMSLEFSRTLLLIGDFFFAGAVGREVASRIKEFLDEKAPVLTGRSGRHGESDGRSISVEFRDVTFTYPNVEEPHAQEPQLHSASERDRRHDRQERVRARQRSSTSCSERSIRSPGRFCSTASTTRTLSIEWMRKQIALVAAGIRTCSSARFADNLHIAKQDASDEELLAALKAAELGGLRENQPPPVSTPWSATRGSR